MPHVFQMFSFLHEAKIAILRASTWIQDRTPFHDLDAEHLAMPSLKRISSFHGHDHSPGHATSEPEPVVEDLSELPL